MNMGIYAELAGTAQAPGEARRLIGLVLDEDHPCADDTALIISELVSNAVAHTRAGQLGGTVLIGVEATGVPPAMRMTVRDPGADGIPVVTDPDPEQEHGRGLHMIAALATEWGSETSAVGRATWCRLMGDATSAARDSDRLTLAAWARRQGQHVRWCVPADEPKCTLAHLAVLGRPGAAPSAPRRAAARDWRMLRLGTGASFARTALSLPASVRTAIATSMAMFMPTRRLCGRDWRGVG